MRSMRLTTLVLPTVLLAIVMASPVRARPIAPGPWVWPLQPIPRVLRYFQPPDSPYGPGHRGVDLAAVLGQPVLAIGAGTVSFAGSVAGHGVVVVNHGRLRSTYQPVFAFLAVGSAVAAGQQLGRLELVGSHCLPAACLHLGVLRGNAYLDPLTLLGPRPVVLKPLNGRPVTPSQPPSPPPLPPWHSAVQPRGRFAIPQHMGFIDEPIESSRGSPLAASGRGPVLAGAMPADEPAGRRPAAAR